ncbi:hypothetical protein [Gilvimarinus polysaccharolyticus]|uniref:hypothetical protein n=1 Tax=Gilvimarinus polysaccharolyticus TaxID=863921 RepID=UPI0006738E9E|nr:hypothetical protein [Gilvimarinus polysaccharolyticus]
MKGIHNLILLTITVVAAACTYVNIQYGLSEMDTPDRTEFLWMFVFALLISLWVIKEPHKSSQIPDFTFGALVFFAWPILLLNHLVKTRGFEGVILFVGFVAIYNLPFLSGLIAYVYFT